MDCCSQWLNLSTRVHEKVFVISAYKVMVHQNIRRFCDLGVSKKLIQINLNKDINFLLDAS